MLKINILLYVFLILINKDARGNFSVFTRWILPEIGKYAIRKITFSACFDRGLTFAVMFRIGIFYLPERDTCPAPRAAKVIAFRFR
jgi:hypothetical protein